MFPVILTPIPQLQMVTLRMTEYRQIISELVVLVKKLRRKNWKTKKQMSYRKISDHLFQNGIVNERGNPYNSKSIREMVQQQGEGAIE